MSYDAHEMVKTLREELIETMAKAEAFRRGERYWPLSKAWKDYEQTLRAQAKAEVDKKFPLYCPHCNQLQVDCDREQADIAEFNASGDA